MPCVEESIATVQGVCPGVAGRNLVLEGSVYSCGMQCSIDVVAWQTFGSSDSGVQCRIDAFGP